MIQEVEVGGEVPSDLAIAGRVQTLYGQDPHGMARPWSIEARKGSTTHGSAQHYVYDPSGNVRSLRNGK